MESFDSGFLFTVEAYLDTGLPFPLSLSLKSSKNWLVTLRRWKQSQGEGSSLGQTYQVYQEKQDRDNTHTYI